MNATFLCTEDAADDGIQKFSSAAGDEVAKGLAARQQLGRSTGVLHAFS